MVAVSGSVIGTWRPCPERGFATAIGLDGNTDEEVREASGLTYNPLLKGYEVDHLRPQRAAETHDTQRWVIRRKAQVVIAVQGGLRARCGRWAARDVGLLAQNFPIFRARHGASCYWATGQAFSPRFFFGAFLE